MAAPTVSAVPDILATGLRCVFCGINPGRRSSAAGCHFANPRNDFWRLLADAGLTPRLLPLPFAAWHVLARVAELLPNPPITRNQVELMEVDTVVSPNVPGLHELGISRHSIEDILRQMVSGH